MASTEQEIKIKVVQEGVEETATQIASLGSSVEGVSRTIQDNTSAFEENAEAISNATNKTVEDILKREEARTIAEKMTAAVSGLAAKIGELSSIQDESTRNSAMMRAGWDGVTAAVSAFNPVVGGALTAVTSVADAYNEWQEAQEQLRQTMDSLTRQTQRLGIDIEAVEEAISGVISAQKLMQTAVDANNAGLRLSTEQMTNLVDASQRYANESGRDVNEVFDEMSQALISRNIPKLREFALVTNEVTDAAEAQTQALEAMSGGVTRVTNSVEQNRQALLNQGRDLNAVNIAMAMQRGHTDHLSDSQKEMGQRVIDANNALNNQATQALRDNAQALRDAEASAQTLIAAYAELQRVMPGGTAGQFLPGMDPTNLPQRRGGGGAGGGNDDLNERVQRDLEDYETMRQKQREFEAQMLAEEDYLRQVNFEAEMARMNGLVEMRRQQAIVEEELRQVTIDATREQKEQELQEYMDSVDRRVEVVSNFTDLSVNLGKTLRQNGKKAMKEELKEWLKNFSIKEAMQGGSDLATAIGYSLNPATANLAAEKYASSAKHFAMAAAAGAGAGGIAASGGGGGGGSKGGNSENGVKPDKPNVQGNSEGAGSITVNIMGQSLLTEGQVGREIQNALNAYERRY